MRSRFLSKFSIPLQFHERLLLCTFLAKTIYTLLIRSPLMWKFLRLSSTRVKFCQITYANFEMTRTFLYKFYILFQFHERQLLYTFLAQTIYTFLKRSPLKWKSLRLSSAQVTICQILLIPNLKRRVDSCPNFVSLTKKLVRFYCYIVVL